MKLPRIDSRSLLALCMLSSVVLAGSGCTALNSLSGQRSFSPQPASCYSLGDHAGYHETHWTSLETACYWEDPSGDHSPEEIYFSDSVDEVPDQDVARSATVELR